MKSVIGLFTSGGAVANLWKSVPAFVKVPAVIGVVVLAGAELTRDVNLGLRSGRVTEGEAVKADAQVVDPVKTRADMQAGKPVSGAERTVAAQYEGLDADARQKQATADAATASEDELLTKAERHERQTSTEKLRLLELQVKAQELAIKEAEARMKSAEATNAEQTAAVVNMVNRWLLEGDYTPKHGKNVATREAEKAFKKYGW